MLILQHYFLAGFACDSFPNAQSAMEALQSDAEYDLVLSDIKMPGEVDGFGLRNWILKQHPGLSVILMSGFYHNSSVIEQISILEKPFTENQLLDAIETAMAEKDSAINNE